MWQGLLLGLASGGACLASCAPVLLPLLLGEGASLAGNMWRLAQFMGGRLAGYLGFAVLAWLAGTGLRGRSSPLLLTGVLDLLLAILLVWWGFFQTRTPCTGEPFSRPLAALGKRCPSLLLVLAGFGTGLSLCPPFLAALSDAVQKERLGETLLFFFSFFFGTAVFFIPLPLAGLLRRREVLRIVGRLAAGVMGIYYFFAGIIRIYGGWQSS